MRKRKRKFDPYMSSIAVRKHHLIYLGNVMIVNGYGIIDNCHACTHASTAGDELCSVCGGQNVSD